MSVLQLDEVYETHAELERRRGYEDASSCAGRMIVIARDSALWEIQCDVCRFDACVPARDADPSLLPRVQAERAARRRERSGIPAALSAVRWEHVADNHPAVLAAAERVASGASSQSSASASGPRVPSWQRLVDTAAAPGSQPPGLLLTGASGVGKTHLAAATANAMLEHRAVRWIPAVSLIAQLSRDFADPVRTDAVDLIAGADSLVLDDLDKARGTEAAAAPLFDAIDRRVTAGAPLIVTANLSLDEIAARFPDPFGDAIASRLAQHCEVFALDGADRRLARFARSAA